MTIEIMSSEKVEQLKYHEIERKYRPLYPEALVQFREQAKPVEQIYLSNPQEPFSLRLREEVTDDNSFNYTATLKDRGSLSESGLNRLEIETEISPDLYDYYKSIDPPCLKKLRSKPYDNVVIDYYENGDIQVEAENPNSWQQFCNKLRSQFVETTQYPYSSNEIRAYNNLPIDIKNEQNSELHPEDIVFSALSKLNQSNNAFIQIGGRSGSGKSTIARQVQQKLLELGVSSEIMSTDDYNRGSSWLKSYNNNQDWSEWDHPIVYDTETMARDLEKLHSGEIISKRVFNFETQEPSYVDTIKPTSVIIIEGIYALSPDISNFDSLKFDISTPLATCVGRRIIRDIKERPTFSDPAASLKYILTQAEPMYRNQLAKRQ